MKRGPSFQVHKMCFDTVCVKQCDGLENKENQHIHTSAQVKIFIGYAPNQDNSQEERASEEETLLQKPQGQNLTILRART